MMRYRIMQNREGFYTVEWYSPPTQIGKNGMWTWVATFNLIDDARRGFPGAAEPDQCSECLGVCEPNQDVCNLCCEHGDMDGGYCLDCGEDRTEDLAAKAYDDAKAARQDG